MSSTFDRLRSYSRRRCLWILSAVALIAVSGAMLRAQQAEGDDPRPALTASASGDDLARLPAAPVPQSSSTGAPSPQDQPGQSTQGTSGALQTKRILGIIPNFRAVSADVKLPPETVKEKFTDATEDSFDYSSIFIPAVLAGYGMHENSVPQFRQGAAGYGRYFWHSAVDQTSENYMVEFVFPTVFRQDARYYTLGHGGFFKRTGYALSRAVVTRSNSGDPAFNVSEVFGAGAAAGISNLYYPSASRSVGNTATQWVLDVAIDAGSFWFREFWPDINRRAFRNKYSQAPAEK
ncbi:MAG TPA: hypothetical protein VMD29_05435 [Terracidiphilus sp.]|nr:hypothetical protein [Terracidiphilus sp.]